MYLTDRNSTLFLGVKFVLNKIRGNSGSGDSFDHNRCVYVGYRMRGYECNHGDNSDFYYNKRVPDFFGHVVSVRYRWIQC